MPDVGVPHVGVVITEAMPFSVVDCNGCCSVTAGSGSVTVSCGAVCAFTLAGWWCWGCVASSLAYSEALWNFGLYGLLTLSVAAVVEAAGWPLLSGVCDETESEDCCCGGGRHEGDETRSSMGEAVRLNCWLATETNANTVIM